MIFKTSYFFKWLSGDNYTEKKHASREAVAWWKAFTGSFYILLNVPSSLLHMFQLHFFNYPRIRSRAARTSIWLSQAFLAVEIQKSILHCYKIPICLLGPYVMVRAGTVFSVFLSFSLFSLLLVGEVPWWLLMAPPKGRVDLSRTCTQPPAVHRLISACYLRTGWYYSLPGCCHCNGDPCPKPTCHSLKYLPVFRGIWNTESVSLMVPVSNGLQLVQ